MQYALVNDIKIEAEKGSNGFCEGCRKEVIAKCGEFNVNHWAHKTAKGCDSWWERETEWHRKWKTKFPPEYREVILWNNETTIFHRADIHTKSGVTIEFQNSPISYDEFRNREQFYSKLIWVINIPKWKDRVNLKNIPDPEDDLIKDLDFQSPGTGLFFYSKAELNDGRPLSNCTIHEFDSMHISNYHFFIQKWKNKPKVWFHSEAYVFFDPGGEYLYRLKRRHQKNNSFWFLHQINKADFISKYSIST